MRRGQRPGATAKYLRRSTSGAPGYGLGTTSKYLRGATDIGLGTTISYLRGAAGVGLGTTIMYLRCSTSGAAGNGLYNKIKYLRGAAGIGLGTMIKYLRRTTNAAAGNGFGNTIKYLVNQNAGAGNNWAKATKVLGTNSAESLCGVAASVVSPTQKRSEGRAPVRGSEFTTKAAALQGGSSEMRCMSEARSGLDLRRGACPPPPVGHKRKICWRLPMRWR
jgi:hypothetical protein